MKLLTYNTFLALGLLFFVSCNSKPTENGGDNTTTGDAPMTCTYAYTKDSTAVRFTAYKFTERAGVNGKFDEFTVNLNSQAKTPEELLSSVEFSIPISSFNTNNAERDAKIKKVFFGALKNTEKITGKVKSVTGGKGVITLKLNDVEKDLEMDYSFEGGAVKLSAVLQLGDWDALPAVAAINTACEELHKGADRTSKLWPDLKINISSTLVKNCVEKK